MRDEDFPAYRGMKNIDCGPDPSGWSESLSEQLGLKIRNRSPGGQSAAHAK